ncbi:MAG: ribonuclease HI [Helicobacteraceae bacterium]|nr:ribonuclease HI [Helicobacteraceae bacterium]
MKKITLYSDGSSLGNPGFGGWCAILKYKDREKILSGAEANVTNNQMELMAVLEGLRVLKESCEVELYSDSKYVCEGINLWIDSWIAKDFKNVKNPNLWKKFLDLSKSHKIKAIWVKGHNGHIENEKCDKIARARAQEIKLQYS